MLMEIVLVGCPPICCISLATFVVVPPESESINCGAYKMNTTNLTWKKLNQAFAITIKRVVYLKNFFVTKVSKVSVCLVNILAKSTLSMLAQSLVNMLTSHWWTWWLGHWGMCWPEQWWKYWQSYWLRCWLTHWRICCPSHRWMYGF